MRWKRLKNTVYLKADGLPLNVFQNAIPGEKAVMILYRKNFGFYMPCWVYELSITIENPM
jgi:hypothetical protein